MPDGNGEFKGQMKVWVEVFENRLAEGEKKDAERHKELLTLIKENRNVVTQQIESVKMETEIACKKHDKYHHENEHKWGIWTLFKRKPVIPIAIFLFIGVVLGTIGVTYNDLLAEFKKFLLK